MKKVLLASAALCIFIASCKKKEGDPSRTDLLTNGKWRMTSGKTTTTIAGSTNTTDFYAQFQPCEKDNYIIFRSDKVVINDEGPTKCNAADSQQVVNGNWSLLDNDTKITLGDGSFGALTIVTLNSTTLAVTQDTVFLGIPASTSITFTHEN